eukprot:scaffold1046_cov162-Ochromonas_danica.AAC.42
MVGRGPWGEGIGFMSLALGTAAGIVGRLLVLGHVGLRSSGSLDGLSLLGLGAILDLPMTTSQFSISTRGQALLNDRKRSTHLRAASVAAVAVFWALEANCLFLWIYQAANTVTARLSIGLLVTHILKSGADDGTSSLHHPPRPKQTRNGGGQRAAH